MAEQVHRFRYAFGIVARYAGRQVLFLGALLLVLFSLQGLWAMPERVPLVLGFTVPALFVGWLLVAAIYYACGVIRPVIISPKGITASSLVGDKRSMQWAAVKDVRQTTISGMPYFQVQSNAGGPDMYISQWLERQDEFWRLVHTFAGPDNPMSRFSNGPSNP